MKNIPPSRPVTDGTTKVKKIWGDFLWETPILTNKIYKFVEASRRSAVGLDYWVSVGLVVPAIIPNVGQEIIFVSFKAQPGHRGVQCVAVLKLCLPSCCDQLTSALLIILSPVFFIQILRIVVVKSNKENPEVCFNRPTMSIALKSHCHPLPLSC